MTVWNKTPSVAEPRCQNDNSKKQHFRSSLNRVHLFYFIRTPNFSPRLDVLIFSAISASNVLIDVLNYFTLKIKYLYSTTVYFILNITVFSLSYNMNWSWKECNRILYWPWQILTKTWKKNFFAKNWGWAYSYDVLIFSGISAWMFL